jgi:hypothetical protein
MLQDLEQCHFLEFLPQLPNKLVNRWLSRCSSCSLSANPTLAGRDLGDLSSCRIWISA